MTKLLKMTLMGAALFGLSACMGEGIDTDSNEDIFTITHTTSGTLYWE